jgi:hypothetical protein
MLTRPSPIPPGHRTLGQACYEVVGERVSSATDAARRLMDGARRPKEDGQGLTPLQLSRKEDIHASACGRNVPIGAPPACGMALAYTEEHDR